MKNNQTTKAVAFEDGGDKITITITGAAYANFCRIADTLNRVPWTDDDNTPATVCDFWIGGLLRRVGYSPVDDETTNVTELTNDLIDGIDTGVEYETEADKARRCELKAALDSIAWDK